jgi:hypothetical protein
MQRVRFLFLLGLVLAVGATSVAKGQDGTPFSKDRDRNSKHAKAESKDNDGHRKHWWSPPHLRHKKHVSDSAASRTGTNSSSKTVAASPMNKTAAPRNPGAKTARATKPGQKPIAKTGQGNKALTGPNPGRKTIAGASHGKKTVRHDCSPEEAKKGGCQAGKGRSQKGTASPS